MKTSYVKNECDKISSNIQNQQNSLSVSLSTSLGINCKTNIGLIIGLSVGIPVLMILIFVFVIFLMRFLSNKQTRDFVSNNKTNFQENKSFEQKTKWNIFKKTNNNENEMNSI